MTTTAAKIIDRVATLIGDAENVHWAEAELLDWLNEGVHVLVTLKPSANTQPVDLALSEGVEQQVPASILHVVRVLFSIGAATSDHVDADPMGVRVIDRNALDAMFPGWMNPATYPFTVHPDDVATDSGDPRTLFVFPGNTGAGGLRIMAAVLPAQMTATTDTVPLADEFVTALTEFVASRAWSKDADTSPGAMARAQQHLAAFGAAIGVQINAEQAASINATRKSAKP